MTTQPNKAPIVKSMRVIPVAGRDDMLMNLSGAHAPFFTRNIVIVQDSAGHTGLGEVPGGEKIRQTLEDCLLYTSPSPRDRQKSRMPSSA